MQFRLLLLLTLFGSITLHAQNRTPQSTITLSAKHAMDKTDAVTALPVLIQGNVAEIRNFIGNTNGQFKFSAGNIVSAEMRVADILALNKLGITTQIDIPTGNIQKLNDVMVIHNNVDSAYLGMWPLEQGYDGTGVVVGVIDAPFDIAHGDFNDANGDSRIKYVWDQNLTDGTAPSPYTYGIECDSAMIADGLCPSTDDYELNYSHGTGVAGIAASSGLAANRYRGVAPNADLILVSMNFETEFNTTITDAIAYIYERANTLGKPCVINTSVGLYDGSHDGTDLTAQLIDAMITEQNGRALVAAAGNAGSFPFHLGYDVTATEQFTWFKKLSYAGVAYFQLYADEAAFNTVNFRISCDVPGTWISKGSTPMYNMLADFNFDTDIIDSVIYTIPGAGDVAVYAQLLNGQYFLEFLITPAVGTDYWRFSTSGSGRFDMWNAEATTGFSNYVTTGLPTAAVLPEIVNYRGPDTDQSIVSSWQCLDNVITVGSYVNRDTMTNFYNVIPPILDVVGALYISSSHGPTRDNRIKPDICAPGARVLSTASSILTNWLIEEGAANYMSQDGQHYLYNGTSFSSPAVAGIAALYLQNYPNATAAEVRDAITSQAKSDTFTGASLPNNLWGYGKADAFRTLTGSWGCGPDDYLDAPENLTADAFTATKIMLSWDLIPNAAGYQIYYKPVAGVAQKAKAFSNTKTLSGLTPNTTYSIKVRAFCEGQGFSNWSETITVTTAPFKSAAEEHQLIQIFPNPAANTFTVEGVSEGGYITMVNALGEIVYSTIVTDAVVRINTTTLQNGIYQLILEDKGSISTQKIMIVH